jgi:hypothetical protein
MRDKNDKDTENKERSKTEANSVKTIKFEVADGEETIEVSKSISEVNEESSTKPKGLQSSKSDAPEFDGDPIFAFGKNEKYVITNDSVEEYGPSNYRGEQRGAIFDHDYIFKTVRQRHSTYFPTSSTLKGSKWLIKLATLIYIVCMWSFVEGNQCSAGTAISQVDEYKIIDWDITYQNSIFYSIYISPTTGASYLNSFLLVSGSRHTAIVKLDSSGTQIYAKYYTSQWTLSYGFTVDNSETYMYLYDRGVTSIEIVKANAADGTVDSVFEK